MITQARILRNLTEEDAAIRVRVMDAETSEMYHDTHIDDVLRMRDLTNLKQTLVGFQEWLDND